MVSAFFLSEIFDTSFTLEGKYLIFPLLPCIGMNIILVFLPVINFTYLHVCK